MKERTQGLNVAQEVLHSISRSSANTDALGGYGGQAAVTAIIALEMMLADYQGDIFASAYIGEPYSLEEVGEWLISYSGKLQENARRHETYLKLIDEAHRRATQAKTEGARQEELATVQFYLNKARQIPLNIARGCISLLGLAMDIYQEGFPSVHGAASRILSLLTQAFLDACFSHTLNLSQIADHDQRATMERGLKDLQKRYLAIRDSVAERILLLTLSP